MGQRQGVIIHLVIATPAQIIIPTITVPDLVQLEAVHRVAATGIQAQVRAGLPIVTHGVVPAITVHRAVVIALQEALADLREAATVLQVLQEAATVLQEAAVDLQGVIADHLHLAADLPHQGAALLQAVEGEGSRPYPDFIR